MKRPNMLILFLMSCALTMPGVACSQQQGASADKDSVRSTLTGRLTVLAEVDPTEDYRDFEVLVAVDNQGAPDTLGYGVTDSTGAFYIEVTAPARGIYALLVSRRGTMLKLGQLAVAEGDSAMLNAAFPLGNRQLRVRSVENAAWMAYRNTKAQHNNSLLELAQGGAYSESAALARVEQTTMILWEMQTMFPNSMGAEVAAADAVLMAGGWNDSIAVARAHEIGADNVRFVDVGRAARQAQARLYGQAEALALLDAFRERAVTEDQRAQLSSESVVAHMDSMEYDAAQDAARALAAAHPESVWAQWAERAIYEIQHMLPGMAAPDFNVITAEGDALALQDLRGRLVLLEFYQPQDEVYQRELEGRNALLAQVGADFLQIVSVSMAADTLLNEAFFDSREAPGLHVYAPEGLARLYNVNVLPTRFLLDASGKIAAKYVGGAFGAIYEEVVARKE